MILAAVFAVAGCGGDDAATPASTPVAGAGTSQDDGGVDQRPDAVDGEIGSPDDDAPDPSPAAQLAGRGLDRLVAAYAPASKRVNFLVTAETLRQDAAESGTDEKLQRERAGLVRIESARIEAAVELARPRVEVVVVDTDAQQRVRASLLAAIDARIRAMAELRAALTAVGRDMADSVVEQRFEAWRQSWDASLRAAREATTAMQEERAALGLDPAPEESFR